mgnify:CR=1 FL=1
MERKKLNPELIVDLRITYRGQVYSLAFGNVLKWLLPLAVIVAKLISHFREAPP